MGMAGNFITIYLHLMECLECKSLIAHGALREFQKKNFNSACIFFKKIPLSNVSMLELATVAQG